VIQILRTFTGGAGDSFVFHESDFDSTVLGTAPGAIVIQFTVSERLDEPIYRQLLLGCHVVDD